MRQQLYEWAVALVVGITASDELQLYVTYNNSIPCINVTASDISTGGEPFLFKQEILLWKSNENLVCYNNQKCLIGLQH